MTSTRRYGPVGPAPDLPADLFASRRARLIDRIGEGVAIIPAARELLKSRDTEVPFRQSSDLYYLTGFPEPDAVAVVSAAKGKPELTLFLRPRAPEAEAWSGSRLGVERAAEAFGASVAYPIAELPERLPELLKGAESVHYPIGVGGTLESIVVDAVATARRTRQRAGSGPTTLVDLEASTGEMRLVKDEHELERIRTAARITAEGHVAGMRRTRPGVGEWEIQAAVEGAFRAYGAAAPAFPSIVGAGENATVLHYVTNRSRVEEEDLVLIDAGAEWGMYCADITRTFPASGRFSGVRKELYEVVLAAEEAAIDAARPGATIAAVHDAAVRVLVRGLLDLEVLPLGEPDGLIESGAYKRFYLHQTSHWLGLDVHDVGPYRRSGDPVPLAPGMVLTIEPGIYIPPDTENVPESLRGVGIRIEDDIVVTEDGNEVITRDVPVDPRKIEALMGEE